MRISQLDFAKFLASPDLLRCFLADCGEAGGKGWEGDREKKRTFL